MDPAHPRFAAGDPETIRISGPPVPGHNAHLVTTTSARTLAEGQRFKYWAHGRDREPEIVTITKNDGRWLTLRSDAGVWIDVQIERFVHHSEGA